MKHPAVSTSLNNYDLGSSESEAKHTLMLDRDKLEMMIAPVAVAEIFLKEQWPPEPPIQMSKEEYLAMISEKLKNVKQPDNIDIEEIQRRIEEQYKKDKKRPFLVMRNGLLRM